MEGPEDTRERWFIIASVVYRHEPHSPGTWLSGGGGAALSL